ncbi:MAG: signal peptidase I [Spirochaetes bacterium]|nr:signal peptidase I [Deltaproteobacteria bacterium]RKY03325.1 MAG: signal peptidase I [Spirochaetota bacterium]
MSKKQKKEEIKQKSALREYVEAILIALLIALFIREYVVQAFKIPTGSMEDTLLVGDRILVNKFIYGVKVPFSDLKVFTYRKPKRDEIIVFIYPKDRTKDFIKRVVGIGGDKVEVKKKMLYLNGRLKKDPWEVHKEKSIIPPNLQPRDYFGPILVPKGKLFVMGDNRDRSLDSRFWGFVDLKDVKGKALIIYFSTEPYWETHFLGVRWERIGKIIR